MLCLSFQNAIVWFPQYCIHNSSSNSVQAWSTMLDCICHTILCRRESLEEIHFPADFTARIKVWPLILSSCEATKTRNEDWCGACGSIGGKEDGKIAEKVSTTKDSQSWKKKTTAADSDKFTPPCISQNVSGGRHGYHTQQRTACKVPLHNVSHVGPIT